jgi:hypothetical protein
MMQWPTATHPAGGHGTLSRCRFAIALLKEFERGGKRTYLKVLKDKVSYLKDGEIIYFNLDWQENRFEALPGREPGLDPQIEHRSLGMGEGLLFERG